jgi:hypothetical protein
MDSEVHATNEPITKPPEQIRGAEVIVSPTITRPREAPNYFDMEQSAVYATDRADEVKFALATTVMSSGDASKVPINDMYFLLSTVLERDVQLRETVAMSKIINGKPAELDFPLKGTLEDAKDSTVSPRLLEYLRSMIAYERRQLINRDSYQGRLDMSRIVQAAGKKDMEPRQFLENLHREDWENLDESLWRPYLIEGMEAGYKVMLDTMLSSWNSTLPDSSRQDTWYPTGVREDVGLDSQVIKTMVSDTEHLMAELGSEMLDLGPVIARECGPYHEITSPATVKYSETMIATSPRSRERNEPFRVTRVWESQNPDGTRFAFAEGRFVKLNDRTTGDQKFSIYMVRGGIPQGEIQIAAS